MHYWPREKDETPEQRALRLRMEPFLHSNECRTGGICRYCSQYYSKENQLTFEDRQPQLFSPVLGKGHLTLVPKFPFPDPSEDTE